LTTRASGPAIFLDAGQFSPFGSCGPFGALSVGCTAATLAAGSRSGTERVGATGSESVAFRSKTTGSTETGEALIPALLVVRGKSWEKEPSSPVAARPSPICLLPNARTVNEKKKAPRGQTLRPGDPGDAV
jgi:hypothetical protein